MITRNCWKVANRMNGDLISRSALLEEFGEEPLVWDGHDYAEIQERNDWEYYTELVKKAPAVDAVEVVKCKDCFYWMKAKVNRSGNLVCPKSGMEIVATDYCSRAEKRKCNYDR